MSQFGMQMPASRGRRGSSLDTATAVAGVAVLCLLVACFVMWQAGSRVGSDGQWWKLQEPGKIQLTNAGGTSTPPAPGPRTPPPAKK